MYIFLNGGDYEELTMFMHNSSYVDFENMNFVLICIKVTLDQRVENGFKIFFFVVRNLYSQKKDCLQKKLYNTRNLY